MSSLYRQGQARRRSASDVGALPGSVGVAVREQRPGAQGAEVVPRPVFGPWSREDVDETASVFADVLDAPLAGCLPVLNQTDVVTVHLRLTCSNSPSAPAVPRCWPGCGS